ncbi:hypothetical protein V6N12_041698, partial [Hibiscus sabdariffa]
SALPLLVFGSSLGFAFCKVGKGNGSCVGFCWIFSSVIASKHGGSFVDRGIQVCWLELVVLISVCK